MALYDANSFAQFRITFLVQFNRNPGPVKKEEKTTIDNEN